MNLAPRNPTPEVNRDVPIKWLPATEQKIYMLDINDELKMLRNVNNDIYNFYANFSLNRL